MPNIEEIYDNVEVFISNLEILLTKNIFKGKFQQEVKTLGTELYKLCKVKQFKIDSSEILSMPSFVDLLNSIYAFSIASLNPLQALLAKSSNLFDSVWFAIISPSFEI